MHSHRLNPWTRARRALPLAALFLTGAASSGCKKDPDQALVVFEVQVAPGLSGKITNFKFSVTSSNVPVPPETISDKKGSFWVGYYMPGVNGSVTILGEALAGTSCTIGSGTLIVNDVRAGQTRTIDASAGALLMVTPTNSACAGSGGAGGHGGGSVGRDAGATDAATGGTGGVGRTDAGGTDAGSNGDGPATKFELGLPCRAATDCASGFCVDGVCCESTCGGSCEACGEAAMPGKCVAVTGAPRGTRPACAGTGTLCGGSCDGKSRATCTYALTTQQCRTPSCATNTATLAANCDGKGACPAAQTVSCGANVCAGPICAGGCSDAQPCAASSYCAGGVCMPKKTNGQTCSAAGDCASGFCADGYCCNTACTGSCQACNLTGSAGTCGPVKSAVDDTCSGKSSCDATGTCKKTSGETCTVASDCTSGNCVDGHCCGSASCGTCQACTGGGGTCVAITSAEDPGVCSGTSTCDANGACKLKAGQSCTTATQCVSGFCADKVCCDTACTGQCEACAQTGSVGTCSAVKGAAVHAACAGAGGACGGSCDGTNRASCAYPTTSCRSESCTGGTAVLAASCDGKGACPAMQTQSCGANTCSGSVCAGGCSSTQPCTAGNYCAAGVCTPTKANGATCGTGVECGSGNCVDGFCCTKSACGSCQACTGSGGTCVSVTNADDPNSACSGTQTCDGSGTCKSKNGQTCQTASQCLSGNCVDTVCCNTACNGSCQYCNGNTPGTCAIISNGTAPFPGHAACKGSGVCAGFCNGVSASCAMRGAETSCAQPSCSSGTNTFTSGAVCDGNGMCGASSSMSCSPFICNGTASCFSGCSSGAQCVANSICVAGGSGTCVKCQNGTNACFNSCMDTSSNPNACGSSCTICSGSTPSCKAGSCTCHTPDMTNLLKNPGFDGTISPWLTSGNAGYDKSNDAENCSMSGSAHVTAFGDVFQQCVKVTPQVNYNLHFRFKGDLPGQRGGCSFFAYTDGGCQTPSPNAVNTTTVTDFNDGFSWSTAQFSDDTPVDTNSVYVECSGAFGTGYFDQIYFSTANAAF
jgi:hypothetical protein